ncbi:MAG: hypothetical protein WA869_21325 [Alloacidobacterium sp.]|jgi:hypothetical protein
MQQNASDFETEFEQALAAYADPGDAGHPQVLTARIVAEMHARQRRRRQWLTLIVAVPALVWLLIVALRVSRHEPRHPAVEIASTPSIAPAGTAVPKAPVVGKPYLETARHAAVRGTPCPLPKLDQFPASTALTEQEQSLVQFVAHAPPNTQQLVANARKQPDEPLRIADLSIPYLDSTTQP